MEYEFFLVLEKRLLCRDKERKFDAYEFIDGEWKEAKWTIIEDRLRGYDPFEDDYYKIGNKEIMDEIKRLSIEQVVEKYGQEVIEKLKDIKTEEKE